MRFHQFFVSVFFVSRGGSFNRYKIIEFPKPMPRSLAKKSISDGLGGRRTAV